MVIRLLHAKVRPGKQGEFKKTLEMLSVPTMKLMNGMVAFYPGQPFGANSNEFVLVTIWKEAAAVENKSDEEIARKIIPEEAWPLLETLNVSGYKAFGVTEAGLRPMFQNL